MPDYKGMVLMHVRSVCIPAQSVGKRAFLDSTFKIKHSKLCLNGVFVQAPGNFLLLYCYISYVLEGVRWGRNLRS